MGPAAPTAIFAGKLLLFGKTNHAASQFILVGQFFGMTKLPIANVLGGRLV
jgi:hypothetical protein